MLMPLAWVYDLITRLRNHLFELKLKPSASFEVCVLCVGNLSVGGTGKSPMTEYLVRLLATSASPAIISRGYKRETTGFRIVGPTDTASTVGDEPFQFYSKLSSSCVVAVGEDRVMAITHLLHARPASDVVILDDAFQHRRVRPKLSILLTTYANPFYDDLLLPAGRLRESAHGAKRADIIVVTKCPEGLSSEEMERISTRIRAYSPAPIYFAAIRYGTPQSMTNGAGFIGKKILLATGIANAAPLASHLKTQYVLVHHSEYKDHHRFTRKDLDRITERFLQSDADGIFTTEKDAMRLLQAHLIPSLKRAPWFYLPMEMVFLKSGEEFDASIRNALISKQ
jgi:tetraacyldisaccharide 4'-kinase